MSDINELREHLFDTLRGLKDGSINVDQARAVSDVAQVLINTAKVEVDYLRATGQQSGTGFVPVLEDKGGNRQGGKHVTPTGTLTTLADGVSHRMR